MGPDAEAHAAVAQERARVQVHELLEVEDLRVELHGPIDVADGEPEMVNTLRGDLVGHAGLLRRAASTLPRPPAVAKEHLRPQIVPTPQTVPSPRPTRSP